MNRIKSFVTYMIIMVMLIGISVLPGQADNNAPTEIKLSLTDATDKAIANNPAVKIAAAAKTKSDIAYREAKRASDKIADNDAGGTYSANLALYLNPKKAKLQGEQAEKVYQVTINQIKVQVEQSFYDLIQAREKRTIAENALLRADDQVRIASVRYDVGTVAKQEVLTAQATQSSSRAALTAARNDYTQKMLELNKVMGLDLNTIIDPQGVFEFTREEANLQNLLNIAMEQDMSLIKAQNSYQTAKWNYDFVVSYYGNQKPDAKTSEQDLLTAELTLQQTKDTLVTTVHQNYYSFISLEEQYDYLLKTAELKKEAYRLIQVSYEVGMTTLADVQKSSDEVKQAELNLSANVHQYNLFKSKLKYNLFS